MKRISILVIISLGVYTLLRNNVFILPGQNVWSTNPDIFYKVFVPLLMIVASMTFLIKAYNNNIFILLFIATLVDAIHHIAIGVNHLYSFTYFEPVSNIDIPEGYTQIVYNYWPSHLIGFMEILVLVYFFRIIKNDIITKASP